MSALDRNPTLFGVAGSAAISNCGLYRYELVRALDPANPRELVVCMVNPSTADARQDDQTIRTLIGIARHRGFGRIRVVNLFAFRSTDVRALAGAADPVGPENDATIFRAARSAVTSGGVLVFAWGSSAKVGSKRLLIDRATAVRAMLQMFPAHAFGFCADGQPRHPLYLPHAAALVPA